VRPENVRLKMDHTILTLTYKLQCQNMFGTSVAYKIVQRLSIQSSLPNANLRKTNIRCLRSRNGAAYLIIDCIIREVNQLSVH